MWAAGCILGEMISGKPMFPGHSTFFGVLYHVPQNSSFSNFIGSQLILHFVVGTGSSTSDQIKRVVEVIGVPSRAQIDSLHSEYALTMLESLGILPRFSWS